MVIVNVTYIGKIAAFLLVALLLLLLLSRLINLSNQLPINTRETNGDGGSLWDFDWDESSLYMHIKNEVAELPTTIEDDVSATLLENFNCVPVFLSQELGSNHYDGFCKQFLWPVFHDKLPLLNTEDGQYDSDIWDVLKSPFPSWELFKSMPVHSKILRGLLNVDLIGFHTFGYARNLMSYCSRMFGLDQKVKMGDVLLEYNGRCIKIKIMSLVYSS
ncbi:glycosyl transferase, family 20 [Artemisia annua]|uniref:Glycosyl transferase, family 20 n=1 Tax=Artemisia annua TaxID=35608 RepID=A0A2U1LM17_ARTAN|nr:glycosyl transferase, family 20 [Artemisia annua]